MASKLKMNKKLGFALLAFAFIGSAMLWSPVKAAAASISIWWPTDNAAVSGTQPFKALVDGLPIDRYSMYWQVDNGQQNSMYTSWADYPHKEAIVDVSGWHWSQSGKYVINIVAKDLNGNILGQRQSTIIVNQPVQTNVSTAGTSSTNSGSNTVISNTQTSSNSTTPSPNNAPVISGNPLSGLTFYVNPNSNARNQANTWRSSRPADAAQMDKIASQPEAKWLGDWNTNVYSDAKVYTDAAASRGQVPVFIAYNIPGRDAGNYSAGGSSSSDNYKNWIRQLASGIGSRKAVVILEPDALAQIDTFGGDQATRYALLQDAVSALKANSGTTVYIDAGNSNWISASVMADRLMKAGLAKADGFAVNVSNYYWTNDSVNYGTAISNLTNGKHFVVDTSRNGLGSNGQWCNPSGRALGPKTTLQTGNSKADAFLWLKNPGESDGNCNGGPSAGVWWPEYALGLAQRAAY